MHAREHFAYVTRTLISLYNEGRLPRVKAIEVEPEYGYATRVTYDDGSVRMTRGGDVGLNPSGSCDVVKDKAQTKHFLRRTDIQCPEGSEFLLHWWADRLRPALALSGFSDMRLPEDAPSYASERLGYPVYVKPVDGSRGSNIHRCDEAADIAAALESYEIERVTVAVVEEAVNLPDYRLVVLDGEVISTYLRQPLAVMGDGIRTVAKLFEERLEQFRREGRSCDIEFSDERIQRCLREQQLAADSVPARGSEVRLLRVSNLSLGGTAKDMTEQTAERWNELAVKIMRSFGLRYCGVDLACGDITDGDSDYSVIEINAAPGLDHYAEVGPAQEAKVRDLYARVLNALPLSEGERTPNLSEL